MRVAIVGCGGMAAHYLSVYRDTGGVEVASCIDAELPAAAKAAALFPHAPLATTDFAEALKPDVDAVVVSTPNHLHRPQAIAAIEAGKHVLLQKPVAASIQDAEAIAEAAKRSTKTVGLYMSYFDQPLIHDLRDMFIEGRFGSVVNCYARLMHRGGMMWSREALAGRPNWRGSIEQTGGGCFIQLAVHYIHIFEWITGARVTQAAAMTGNLHCPGLQGEDLATAILRLDSGATVTLDTAWCADGEELAIHGTGGSMSYRANRWLAMASDAGPFTGRVIRYGGGSAQAFGGMVGAEQRSEVVPPPFGDVSNPLNQHMAFLEAARAGAPPPVTVESGVWDMRVVAAVYESARTGRVAAIASAPKAD